MAERNWVFDPQAHGTQVPLNLASQPCSCSSICTIRLNIGRGIWEGKWLISDQRNVKPDAAGRRANPFVINKGGYEWELPQAG